MQVLSTRDVFVLVSALVVAVWCAFLITFGVAIWSSWSEWDPLAIGMFVGTTGAFFALFYWTFARQHSYFGASTLIGPLWVVAIATFAFVGAPVLIFFLPHRLTETVIWSIQVMFPFIFVSHPPPISPYAEIRPLVSYPWAATVLHWLSLAVVTVAIQRWLRLRSAVLIAFAVVALSAVGFSFFIRFFSLHVHFWKT
jgi:hypothetical protein